MNGKRDMRKKFVKSSRPTYKKRIKKAQQGMRFVNYNVVENPTVDYKDITNPTNPFSEYNFNTTYNKPTALVVPVRDTNETDAVANNSPTVEPVVSKVTYTPKAYKGLAEFNKAYDEVEASNPEAKKYRQFLTKMAEQESGFNSAIQNRAGAPAYGYFQFMQDDKKYNNIRQYAGTDIETFRSNPKLQIEAAIKLAKSFEKGFSKEDLELAKKNGYSTWGLLGGAWLAGNGGVRKFLQGKGNPSDRHWSKEGKGTDVATRIKAFNFKEGGIIKYQEPAQPINRRDAVKDYRPAILLSPIKQPVKPYMPTQQPMLSQDNRTGWDKEVSKQIKADKAKNDNLYNSQHVWNWSAPFTNARVTKDNASAMFDFDKSATMSTFAIGTGIANPVTTATSMAGSLVGAGIGKQVAGDKGALVGGLVGGLAGNKAFNTARNVSKNLGIVAKPFQGESDITDNILKLLGKNPKEVASSKFPINEGSLNQQQLQLLSKFKEAGVDVSRLTSRDLEQLLKIRRKELFNTAPGRFSMVEPYPNGKRAQTIWDMDKSNQEEPIGYINLISPLGSEGMDAARYNKYIKDLKNQGLSIGMVENTSNGKFKGVQERMLNSSIQVAHQQGLKGVVSGETLESPEITTKVWKHYPSTVKQLISKDGEHKWGNHNPNMTTDYDGDVYMLLQPSYKVPTKSVLFDPKIIDSFGKMHIDWGNPDIYKVGIPTIMGTKLMSTNE